MKKQRYFVWLFLGAYIFLLLDFTLLDSAFGRNLFNVQNWSADSFANYFENSVNLSPFATIRLYITGLRSGNIAAGYFFVNIIGNIIMLMPLAFFIPFLFKKYNSFFKFLIFILIFSLLIEILQLVFLTGACDIDDIILNVFGAVASYPLFKKLKSCDEE